MKRIICEDVFGNEIFSFDFEEDINIQNSNNCKIADVEEQDGVTIIRLQELDTALPF